MATIDTSDPAATQTIRAELTRRFGLHLPLAEFHRFLKRDRRLAPLSRRMSGISLLQKTSPFEALVTAITDQQLNVAFASELKRRLITTYGRRLSANGIHLWTFPSPRKLAALEDHALRPLQYSRAKSSYIVRLARGIVDGSHPLERWSPLPDEELTDRLCAIHGVGRWTAEYAAMVGFGRLDLVPAADVGLQKAVMRFYRLRHRPDEREVRDIAGSWRPWRGLVTYLLWHAYE